MIRTQIKKILHSFGYTIYNHRVLNKQTPIKHIQQRNIPLDDIIMKNDKQIEIKSLGIVVNLDEHKFIFDKYHDLVKLKENNSAKFVNRLGGIYISIDNLNFRISTKEEIIILREVFSDGIYNVYLDNNKSYILVDIGMNVGITSLFFANKKNIVKTYSFEPFLDTYEDAKKNIKLNPAVESKLNTYEWGIGVENKSDTWIYNYDYKGSMGVNGLPAHIKIDNNKNQTITVLIKDIADVLTQIKKENPAIPLILKIDCEGSEYAILEKMNKHNLFENICVFMIEWHVNGPKELIDYLQNNGYSIFSFFEHDKVIGMIYAVKTSI